MLSCFTQDSKNATPIFIVANNHYQVWLGSQTDVTRSWLKATGFRGDAGTNAVIPDSSGNVIAVVCCVDEVNSFWAVGALPMALPDGDYRMEVNHDETLSHAIVWGLGSYQFSRYKQFSRTASRLCLPHDLLTSVENIVTSIYLVRDLINTPTDDMGPSELANVAEQLSHEFEASFKQVIGDDLLKAGLNAIHTVGRASDDAPRLLDLRWGNEKHPKLVLVGKGVCFDTGGLDIKPSSGMLLMKKDMGGAAHVLGLARMIMAANLPVNLRVLIPAVENAISGNAYRPGDVIKTKKGITVEIGNTDAEGRLVLADALTEAVSDNPDLIIDMATLTGAARVALGTDLPAMFTNRDDVAHAVIRQGDVLSDPLWRMPLFTAYRESLNSQIADINNNSVDSYGGAITAALFLKEFVPENISWMHFDLMAWNLRARPGRPQGGEAMVLRALFAYLSEWC